MPRCDRVGGQASGGRCEQWRAGRFVCVHAVETCGRQVSVECSQGRSSVGRWPLRWSGIQPLRRSDGEGWEIVLWYKVEGVKGCILCK